MDRRTYLDEVCRLVSKGIEEAGKLEALNWLYDSEDLAAHPWLDDRPKCMEILEVSPNWRSYFLALQNGCNTNTEDDGDDIWAVLENVACSAMFEDCNDILERIVQADEEIEKARQTLDAASQRKDDAADAVAAARLALEKDVIEAEAGDDEDDGDEEEALPPAS